MPSIEKRLLFAGIIFLLLLIAGCSVRSISDSGYRSDSKYRHESTNPFYEGELSEFDVIGLEMSGEVTEDQIQKELENHTRVDIKRGVSIMLVQSGALIPDDQMTQGLEKYYKVSVFSGVPSEFKEGKNYSKKLRFAAAKAGCEAILCYWGLLETARESLGTKVVSWAPVVGGVLPDESQKMRIRLKVAVVDVRSGSWDMFSPKPFDDSAISGRYSREGKDQEQVATLKEKAYEAAIEDIVKRYAN